MGQKIGIDEMIADFSYAYSSNSTPLSLPPFWPSRARTN